MQYITNTDTRRRLQYKIARLIFAETGGAPTLRAAEALASMLYNIQQSGGDIEFSLCDADMFDVLCPDSECHDLLFADENNMRMQMCLRVADRMLHGTLGDVCSGATRFHRDGVIPNWARARGYIAEVDNLLFYRTGLGDE